MFSEKEVPEWAEILDTADLPHVYFITFAAIVGNALSLIFPWTLAYFLVKILAELLIPKEDAAFIVDHYLPELKDAISGINVSHADRKSLAFRGIGTLIKIGYAFMWQEFFIPLNLLYNEITLPIAAKLLPDVNDLANKISGVPQTDVNVNTSKNVYPGDAQCRGYSPHALWHEASANGLLEIVFLCDYVNKILTTPKSENLEIYE
jgi:hypothetical protein